MNAAAHTSHQACMCVCAAYRELLRVVPHKVLVKVVDAGLGGVQLMAEAKATVVADEKAGLPVLVITVVELADDPHSVAIQ